MGESEPEEVENQPCRMRPQTGLPRFVERKSVRGESVRGESVGEVYELLLQQCGLWVLCQSQRSRDTNGEEGNDDEEFLEDRAANQGRHILTLLTDCQIADPSDLTANTSDRIGLEGENRDRM